MESSILEIYGSVNVKNHPWLLFLMFLWFIADVREINWTLCWKAWLNIGTQKASYITNTTEVLSHSQVLLTGYVQIFHALFPHLKSGFLREDVESLGKVLMSCAQVPLGQLGFGVFRLISDFLFCFSTFDGLFWCEFSIDKKYFQKQIFELHLQRFFLMFCNFTAKYEIFGPWLPEFPKYYLSLENLKALQPN